MSFADLYYVTLIIPLLLPNITTVRSNRVVEIVPIIGGKKVEISAYNYIASLSYQDQHICSATILDKDWLLTSAHCIINHRREDLKVIAGVTDLLHPSFGRKQQTNISEIIIHEKYDSKNESSIYNNLALIKVQDSFNISTHVGIAKISSQRAKQINRYYLPCSVLGWGSKRDLNKDEIDFAVEPTNSNNLLSVELYLLPNELCNKLFFTQKDESLICIGALDNFYHKCPSDGGGPVICMNMVVGIPSYNTDFCQILLFTTTDYYSDWINSKIKLNNISETYGRYEWRKQLTKNCQASFRLKEHLMHIVISFLLHSLY